jgi:4'-phosphopantetheinyl transferase
MTEPRESIRVAWAPLADRAARRETAWDLVRALLPGARLSNPCPFCGGPHGPLRVHGVAARAGVAYTADLAVVAVADASSARAIGVDAEAVDAAPAGGSSASPGSTPALERVLAPGAGIREWTRIEAVLKADGRGLRLDPAAVAVSASADGDWSARVAGRTFRGRDIAGPPGVLVAVAVL